MRLILWMFVFNFISSCTSIYFQPTQEKYSSPDKYNISYDSFYFHAADGVRLHAWHLKRDQIFKEPRSLVLFFHGNAENLSSHYTALAWLTTRGHEVMIFDYRGYGESQGLASMEGVHLDSIAALEMAYGLHQKIGSKKFIVYGQSLGGPLALRALVDFKHRDQIDLMVQDSTFTSFKNLAKDHMKSIWVTWPFSPLASLLFSDKFAPEEVMEKLPLSVPVLVIHGKKDEVVPYSHGEKLFERIKGPKLFWPIENGTHIDVFYLHDRKYRDKFADLIDSLPPKKSEGAVLAPSAPTVIKQ